MKKLNICLFLLLFATFSVRAQYVEEQQSALVYYMPKTTLNFDVEYEEILFTPGVFYQYAERYLGVKKIKTKEEHCFSLNNVYLSEPTTEADTTRSFVVNIENMPMLQLSSQKTLLAVGTTITDSKTNSQPSEPTSKNNCHRPTLADIPNNELPMLYLQEEQLLANSIAKMAEGAAKQIYHLREARVALISADNDTPVQDGDALKVMLRELDRQEKALTELFVGQKEVIKHKTTINFYPQETIKDSVLFRFSEKKGIVAANDLSGEPVYISLVAHKQTYKQAEEKKKGKQPVMSDIYINSTGKADIEIFDLNGTFVPTQTIDIAQFGVSVPLTEKTVKKAKKIILNPATADLIYIEK